MPNLASGECVPAKCVLSVPTWLCHLSCSAGRPHGAVFSSIAKVLLDRRALFHGGNSTPKASKLRAPPPRQPRRDTVRRVFFLFGGISSESLRARLAPRRANDGNDFPLVSSINAEVAFVYGEDGEMGMDLAHPHQAEVGKIGGAVVITFS
jgi:hypothetical protein